jgi:thioredoxin reductase (NADPH)
MRALRLLEGQKVPYEFRDLDESPELDGYVADLNQGKRVIPTIQIDNEVLINPSDQELSSAVQQAAAERP